jgi:hypothetical protein
MSEPEKHSWQGRPVTFQDFTVGDLDGVREAFAASSVRGMWHVLALSARYVDTGEKVFTDTMAVEASPARYAPALARMAGAAMTANGLQDAAPTGDAPLA